MKQITIFLSGMPVFVRLSVVIWAFASIISCKKNSDPPADETKTSYIRVVHASPRSGELVVQAGDKKIADKIKYLNQPDGYITVTSTRETNLQVSDANGAAIAKGTYTLDHKYRYTLFVYDTLDASKKLKYTLLKDTFSAPGTGKTNFRFLHLAPNTPAVDIDLFKGRDSLRLVNGSNYIGNAPVESVLSPFSQVISGDYRVKVKIKSGTRIITILEIPSLSLMSGKTVTIYLRGLVKGTAGNELGLQVLQH